MTTANPLGTGPNPAGGSRVHRWVTAGATRPKLRLQHSGNDRLTRSWEDYLGRGRSLGFCSPCLVFTFNVIVSCGSSSYSALADGSLESFQHHRSYDDLAECGQRGCTLCRLMAQSWTLQDVRIRGSGQIYLLFDGLRREPSFYLQLSHADEGSSGCLQFGLCTLGSTYRQHAYSYALQIFNHETILNRQQKGRIDSPATFSTISSWLTYCAVKHRDCGSVDSPMPARVLDVGPPDGSQEPFLYSASGARGAYLVLSHCWGGELAQKTTAQNIVIHQQGMPLQSLPATFRDAVLITRRLGFRYLWIDALCIIQDSDEDWSTQSAKMSSIFGNALLMISASQSPDTTSGILREDAEMERIDLPEIRFDQPLEALEFNRQRLLGELHMELWVSPLSRRGWTLQESLLAPRIIHFTRQQVFWECRTCRRSEIGDCVIPPERSRSDTSDLRSFFGGFAEAANAPFYLYLLWYKMIENYSKRSLTFNDDKLPAIAGLVPRIRSSNLDIYLHGLWQLDLPRGIAWRWDEWSSERTPKSCARAPSWSWASTDGSITWGSLETRNFTDIGNDRNFELLAVESTQGNTTDVHKPTTCLKIKGSLMKAFYDDLGQLKPEGPLGENQDDQVTISLQMDCKKLTPRACYLFPVYQSEWLVLEHIEASDDKFVRIGHCRIYDVSADIVLSDSSVRIFRLI